MWRIACETGLSSAGRLICLFAIRAARKRRPTNTVSTREPIALAPRPRTSGALRLQADARKGRGRRGKTLPEAAQKRPKPTCRRHNSLVNMKLQSSCGTSAWMRSNRISLTHLR
jgi:hypothetical protein